MGDGLLLEFPSVVAAVECAVAIQKLMVERNADVPELKRVVYRIGVNLGDVLIDGDDILGEGVNIAARLEGICEPGGVLISSTAYDHVRGKIDDEFHRFGREAPKEHRAPGAGLLGSIKRAQVPRGSARRSARSRQTISRRLPCCRSPAFPRRVRTQIPDGEPMTRDLITILARIPGFIVIARQSSFAYQGRSVDSRQIGRELGVRYIIACESEARQPAASRRRAADRRDDWGAALGRSI